ncbi:hypothetical protein Fmac_014180 [Flemingia macrophylla]|uniref:Uncharacterized protein n=1 Tax=Flemingia macrophylla TaxID=520843 RepID=A0ABD1MAZ4_9FABA
MAVEVTNTRLNEKAPSGEANARPCRNDDERIALLEGEGDVEHALGPGAQNEAKELLDGARLAEEDANIAIGEDAKVSMERVHQ